jgi:hypothetical protein
MSSEPRLFRYEHRRYGELTAKPDFVVAKDADEAAYIVNDKLTREFGKNGYVVSEFVEASFDDLPDDEEAFERYTREMDRRKPKPPERGPFWQFRVGENYRQRALVYADSKPAAVAKMTERLLADGGRFHSAPPQVHPAVQSLSLDQMRARVSGRSSVFASLTPQDAEAFTRDLLAEHVAALLDHHAEAVKRLEAEAAEGELALPSTVKAPKPRPLLLEGLEHCRLNAAVDETALPEAVHAAGAD